MSGEAIANFLTVDDGWGAVRRLPRIAPGGSRCTAKFL
jgi:hypothetical protein